MTVQASEAQLRAQIRADVEKRMRAQTGLNWHVLVYVMVNALLFVINELTTPFFQWFLFPLAAWGIGLVFHVYAVRGGTQKRDQIEAEVERELARRMASSR